MNTRPQSAKERMIHIRLDEETHRRLKIHAAKHGVTIQQTVESLIHLNMVASPRKNIKQ